ncbi:MAG: hypothetical protein AB7I38_14750 [Dehalococcoidia bacterium]
MRWDPRWLATSVLLFAAVASLIVTYTANPLGLGEDESVIEAPSEAAQETGLGVLYVQTAAGGTLRDLGDGTHALQLRGVAPRSTYFSDRPARDAGTIDANEMLTTVWDPTVAPPNASLVATNADGERVTVPFELIEPAYDSAAATLMFTATPLEQTSVALRSLELAPAGSLAGEFTEAELFIDDATQHCVITVENYTSTPFVLRSSDASGASWPSGAPADVINPIPETVTFKLSYKTGSHAKTGEAVYAEYLEPSRSVTLEVHCRGGIHSHVESAGGTVGPGSGRLSVNTTFPSDGSVRFAIYELPPIPQ